MLDPQKPHILVVEDDTLIRENLQYLLEDQEFQVTTSIDGKDAWEKLQLFTPDLILCDVRMPNLTGYELLTLVRNREEFANIPFILLTATCDRLSRRKGMEMGASDWIEKPFTVEEVLKAVESQLSQEHHRLLWFNRLKRVIGDSAADLLNNDSNKVLGLIDLAIEQIDEPASERLETLQDLRTCLLVRAKACDLFLKWVEIKTRRDSVHFQ